MKRPIVLISVIFVSIICSTALVSTAISSICKSFYKNDTEKSVDMKAIPADKQLNESVNQASVKL